MKRKYIFNWEIATIFCFGGSYTLITNSGAKYMFNERGSQFSTNYLFTTFLTPTENIIEDTETVTL